MSIQSELAQEAKCFCFNDATERAVVVYLLLSKTGLLNMTPSQLAVAAKAYSYDLDTWKKIVAYLLAVDAGLQGDTPKQLADAAKCYCFDEGTWKKVVAFLLASGGSGPVDCPQDMQVAWTPTNIKLGEKIGFSATGDMPGVGPDLSFDMATNDFGFILQGSTGIVSLSFPLLTAIDPGQANISPTRINQNTALTSISMPILDRTWDDLDLGKNPLLASIDLSLLRDVENNLLVEDNASLTTLNLPSLVTVTASFQADSCPLLTTVSVPQWIPTNNTQIFFQNDALNATSVEQILRRCVLAGVTTCTIKLNGGTNAGTASLNAQGQADVATLGAQLTINP